MAIQEFQEFQGDQVKQEKMVQREVQLGRNGRDGRDDTQGARGICQLPSVDKTCVVIRNGISNKNIYFSFYYLRTIILAAASKLQVT